MFHYGNREMATGRAGLGSPGTPHAKIPTSFRRRANNRNC